MIKVQSIVLSALFFGTATADQGECLPSGLCQHPNLCCSQYNYCGNDDAHCGEGCKSGPCQQCSIKKPCFHPNDCCSEEGWCGADKRYCGPGCQNGPCWPHNQNSGGGVTLGGVGDRCLINTAPCAGDLCCSEDGFCASEYVKVPIMGTSNMGTL